MSGIARSESRKVTELAHIRKALPARRVLHATREITGNLITGHITITHQGKIRPIRIVREITAEPTLAKLGAHVWAGKCLCVARCEKNVIESALQRAGTVWIECRK